ncbi:TPR repeat [Saliniramus fredricksonii]|uniref:TPR repeat n=2 Tax=Saliniramus fredricksonii TaxID=1653334 RepID=A0ABY0K5D5_9HYPH|nr:TPR repeat [Saliniramus fredricksonii]
MRIAVVAKAFDVLGSAKCTRALCIDSLASTSIFFGGWRSGVRSAVFWLGARRAYAPVFAGRLCVTYSRSLCDLGEIGVSGMQKVLMVLAASVFSLVANGAVADFEMCWSNVSTRNYDKAYDYCKEAAEQGNATAQGVLGFFYSSGLGVERDDATAFYWYKLSAEQGNDGAQLALGTMYSSGRGVKQDDSKAFYFYKLSADQGNAYAQLNVGISYAEGSGVLQNYAEARSWFLLSALAGNMHAQFRLGQSYALGEGVEKSNKDAVRWYKRSAKQGDAQSQLNLGVIYASGDGILQNNTVAHMWFNIAAANGDANAIEYRNRISESMTNEQIAEAQSRAQRCMSSNYTDC